MQTEYGSAEDDYPLLIGLGTLALAYSLSQNEQDDDRQEKMERVVEKKRTLLFEAFADQVSAAQLRSDTTLGELERRKWSDEAARTFLVDLSFVDPFAPWELKYKQDHLAEALKTVAARVGLAEEVVDEIHDIRKSAARAHHHVHLGRIAFFGLGGAAVIGAGGWALAPTLGAALGSAAGLGGAAATNFGLALLGGGSLAAGGFGVAGGMAVVAGIGAAAGLVGGSGAQLMMQLGAKGAQAELIKLQVNYKATLLATHLDHRKAQVVAKSLADQQEEFERRLDDERELNESNARRLKELEDILESIRDAREWIDEQVAA